MYCSTRREAKPPAITGRPRAEARTIAASSAGTRQKLDCARSARHDKTAVHEKVWRRQAIGERTNGPATRSVPGRMWFSIPVLGGP